MSGGSDWPSWISAFGSTVSAGAAFFAWKTSKSALSVSLLAEERARREALSTSKERYAMLVGDIRMKKALLEAFSQDVEGIVQELLQAGLNELQPKIKQLRLDIEANQNVVQSTKKLLELIKSQESQLQTVDQYVEATRGLLTMQLAITAAVDRLGDIRARSTVKL